MKIYQIILYTRKNINKKQKYKDVEMDFNRSLLSIAIAAVTAFSFSSGAVAQCAGSPASEGGDIVISVEGETCGAVSVDASPDPEGNGRVGNISVKGTIDTSGDGAALYINAVGQFDGNEPNVGNIINSGTLRSAREGIQVGSNDQPTTGIIGDITNVGEIYSVWEGIEVELGGNGQVGTIENQNRIESSSRFGLFVGTYGNSSVQDVINSGTIKSDDDAFKVYARENSTVGHVINSGDIQSGYWGLVVQTNNLEGDDGNALVGTVTNSGTINSDQDALYVFANRGTIGDVLNSGTLISQRDYGLYVRSYDEGTIGTVTNTGSITSVEDDAVGISGNAHTFINNGTITSSNGDAVEVYGDLNQLINSGTMTGLVSFNGQGNTFILAGGLVNGNVEGVPTINVTGRTELTGNITSSDSGVLSIYDTGHLIVGGSGDVVYDTGLNQQGQMTVRLGAENNLNNEGATARLTLQSQVVPQMDEPVNFSSPAITFSDGASVFVTPDYDGDFAYGDTEQYRVLSAGNGITGTASVSSESILYTVDDSSVVDGQHLDVTVSTTDLSAVVAENTSDALVTQVAGFLESYLGSLDQQATAGFIDSEQLLTISDADGLIDYLQQQYPNGDTASLAAVAAAVEQMQGEVFNNLLTRLASLRGGGRSGVSSGDLVEQSAVWIKAIGSEADQNSQSSNGTTYSGYKSRLKGISFGGDTDLSDTYTLGASFSYAEADVNVKDSSASSDIESYQLSVYSNWQRDDWFVDSVVNVGFNNT
ncbi:hypothetical protein GV64_17080 [Endozoicomonas elysicola]|uniref:Autotransporter domain-containing protein n=1 Tax=Endozoicomonas elysicola TaxID=305900 RepID=A0A081KDI6_9GAMM|nr:hypothetical protein GV64_17080 [Endozoicomonas elysicola]